MYIYMQKSNSQINSYDECCKPMISFNFPRFSWSTLELSFSSKRLLVEFKLALYGFLSTYLHTNSIISFLHLRCMVGSGLWIWAKEQPISWGSFRAQSILAPLDGMFITEWTDIECVFLWIYTLPSSRHRKLTEHGRGMQNTNSLPKFYVEVEENFIVPGTELIFKCFLNSTCE